MQGASNERKNSSSDSDEVSNSRYHKKPRKSESQKSEDEPDEYIVKDING
jgi:hypothetical protein